MHTLLHTHRLDQEEPSTASDSRQIPHTRSTACLYTKGMTCACIV